MYLKIKNKKIKIIKLDSFWKRFKGLKFVLEPIDYGVMFPKKKTITTDFLCKELILYLQIKIIKSYICTMIFLVKKEFGQKEKYTIYIFYLLVQQKTLISTIS